MYKPATPLHRTMVNLLGSIFISFGISAGASVANAANVDYAQCPPFSGTFRSDGMSPIEASMTKRSDGVMTLKIDSQQLIIIDGEQHLMDGSNSAKYSATCKAGRMLLTQSNNGIEYKSFYAHADYRGNIASYDGEPGPTSRLKFFLINIDMQLSKHQPDMCPVYDRSYRTNPRKDEGSPANYILRSHQLAGGVRVQTDANGSFFEVDDKVHPRSKGSYIAVCFDREVQVMFRGDNHNEGIRIYGIPDEKGNLTITDYGFDSDLKALRSYTILAQ